MKNAGIYLLRHLAIGSLVGIFAGALAGGLGSRLAMRITALMTADDLQGRLTEAQARVGEISSEGTLFLIFFAAFLGIYGGILYRASVNCLPKARWLKGLCFGLLLLLWHGSLLIEGDNFDFDRFGSAPLNIAMFALLPIIFGLISSYTEAWLEQVFPAFSLHPKTLVYLPALLGGTFLVLLTANSLDSLSPSFSSNQFGNPEQGLLTLVMIVLIILNLVFEALLKQVPYSLSLRRLALIAPAIYGAFLLYQAILEIMS